MPHLIDDQNRRKLDFFQAKVKDILPEFYQSEYSDFVTFLEKYYEYLEDDNTHSFAKDISSVLAIRDISQASEESLDELLTEIGNGLTVASFFKQPRLMIRLLADFYKVKGTLVSAEGFFRAFFNEEVTIEYPKRQIFIVNESEIGYESQKFIQDAGLYQIFSILVKVGISVADYESLYKRFVHPAGWHFAGEVLTEGEVNLGVSGFGLEPLESDGDPVLTGVASQLMTSPFSQLTGIIDSNGQDIRTNLTEIVSLYQDITVEQLDKLYGSTIEIITPNSFTFDDSDNTSRPDTTMTLETMDNTIFTRYTSDSAI